MKRRATLENWDYWSSECTHQSRVVRAAFEIGSNNSVSMARLCFVHTYCLIYQREQYLAYRQAHLPSDNFEMLIHVRNRHHISVQLVAHEMPSLIRHSWLGDRKGIQRVKNGVLVYCW